MMNANTIVGYITRPNGSPISGAEVWIGETADTRGRAKSASVRTDARGYFQLSLAACEPAAGGIFGSGESLKVSVGRRAGIRKNAESGFQVTGYLISETLDPEA